MTPNPLGTTKSMSKPKGRRQPLTSEIKSVLRAPDEAEGSSAHAEGGTDSEMSESADSMVHSRRAGTLQHPDLGDEDLGGHADSEPGDEDLAPQALNGHGNGHDLSDDPAGELAR